MMPDPQSQARALARLLDSAFTVPGTRFRIGLDPIIGLIPGIGDMVGTGLSAYILWLAARAGAPALVLVRMAGNVAIEMIVGTIPLIGDLFDAGWKANNRNVRLLEDYLDNPYSTARSSMFIVIGLALFLFALLVVIAWAGVKLLQAIF